MEGVHRIWHFLGVGILLLWSAAMLYFYVSGRVVNYLSEPFQTFCLIGGIALLVLALFNLATTGVAIDDCGGGSSCGHSHDHDHNHGHGHGHAETHDHAHHDGHDHDHGDDHSHGHDHHAATFDGGLVALLVLVVPLVVSAARTPDAFSKSWAMKRAALVADGTVIPAGASLLRPEKRGDGGAKPTGAAAADGSAASADPYAYTMDDFEAQVDKSAAGNFMLTIQEIFYTAGDVEIQNVVTGIPVETVGQILPDTSPSAAPGRLRVFRMFMQCCAADARPLSVPVEFEGGVAPEFKEMGWYNVSGRLTFKPERGMTVPVIEGVALEAVPEPKDRMLF